jgi:phenylacetate-CoA ligase
LLASFIKSHNIKNLKLNRFLYGGDLLLESQYLFIKDLFPEAIITSTGYASSDAGFLGYADKTCKINEYRTDSAFTIPEIIDLVTKKPIEGLDKPGILLATNLTKTLIPVIRYPVGDIAMWMEPKGTKNRKLKLMGRVKKKENLIEIGEQKFDFQDFYQILSKSRFFLKILGFQIELKKNGTIFFKIALEKEENAKEEIRQTLIEALPRAAKSKIKVEIIHISEMQFNSFTYKSVKIVK